MFYRFVRSQARFWLTWRHHLKIYGLENCISGAAILAPNHTSFYDPPLIAAIWPKEVHFLAQSGLFRWCPFRWLFFKLNAHALQRESRDVKAFKLAIQIVNQGNPLVIFPEGSRSSTGEFQTIKGGVSAIAIACQCPIVPIYIHGAYEIWPRQKRFPQLKGSIECVIGKPIKPYRDELHSKKEIQEKLIKDISYSWNELKKWYLDGAKGIPP